MPALPPNWRTDPTLEAVIPPPHDYHSFARLPEHPDRYAVCICGSGAYDIQNSRFLDPQVDKETGRTRFRFNLNNATKGQRNPPIKVFYARVIATLVYGPRGRNFQAHHSDHCRTNDTWSNLCWTTARANKRLAVQHADRSGDANPNAELSFAMLGLLIEAYDDAKRRYGEAGTKHLAAQLAARFDITPTQVRRLAKGKSRRDEVERLRKAFAKRANISQEPPMRTLIGA